MKSIPNKLTNKIDKPLDKHLIRSDDPLPKTTRGLIYIISGRKGSGKTSLMINLLSNKKEGGYKKYFDNIFLISPTARTDEKMSKLTNELDEDGKYFDTLTPETLDDITDTIKLFNNDNKQEQEPRNLLIIDDCMCDLPSRQSKNILNKIVVLARHYKLSVWFLVQKYNSINTIIRSNADLISFFKTDNEKEYKTLEDDIFINSQVFREIYDYATDGSPNNFLHINLLSNPPTFYKKFDKIILE